MTSEAKQKRYQDFPRKTKKHFVRKTAGRGRFKKDGKFKMP